MPRNQQYSNEQNRGSYRDNNNYPSQYSDTEHYGQHERSAGGNRSDKERRNEERDPQFPPERSGRNYGSDYSSQNQGYSNNQGNYGSGNYGNYNNSGSGYGNEDSSYGRSSSGRGQYSSQGEDRGYRNDDRYSSQGNRSQYSQQGQSQSRTRDEGHFDDHYQDYRAGRNNAHDNSYSYQGQPQRANQPYGRGQSEYRSSDQNVRFTGNSEGYSGSSRGGNHYESEGYDDRQFRDQERYGSNEEEGRYYRSSSEGQPYRSSRSTGDSSYENDEDYGDDDQDGGNTKVQSMNSGNRSSASTGSGRGWHGDSEGHAAAGRHSHDNKSNRNEAPEKPVRRSATGTRSSKKTA